MRLVLPRPRRGQCESGQIRLFEINARRQDARRRRGAHQQSSETGRARVEPQESFFEEEDFYGRGGRVDARGAHHGGLQGVAARGHFGSDPGDVGGLTAGRLRVVVAVARGGIVGPPLISAAARSYF